MKSTKLIFLQELMLMRKEALDKVGLLDETFFTYGEDIDLSYRLIKGGYKTTISLKLDYSLQRRKY